MDAPLRSRHREILSALLRAYIETGEPIGSRTLSRTRVDALSAASIRNVMADLADEGFLSQPHTSAGRIPTAKAFRFFVHSLQARVTPSESERLRTEFSNLHSVGARMERSSHVLMELTRNVGIAAVLPAVTQELDQIELVTLADQRVLMILVTRDGMVRNRIVAVEQPVSPEELVSIRNYVNHNFGGWKLGEARRELLRRMAEERALYNEGLRNLQMFYRKGLLDDDASPEVHMEGAWNLLGLDLDLTREKLRELMRALEEKQRLIELLDQFLDQPAGELEVHVGLEEAHPSMRDLALIGMTVRLASGVPAKVAVLGPMRMQYERVMGAVLQTCRALESTEF
jgi:heat-inducible transcriptional repressor